MNQKQQIFLLLFMAISNIGFAQNNTPNKVEKVYQKGQSILQVFQPYLVKAQSLYQQGKQLVNEVKNTKLNNSGAPSNSNSSNSYGSNGSNSTNGSNSYNGSNNQGSNNDPAQQPSFSAPSNDSYNSQPSYTDPNARGSYDNQNTGGGYDNYGANSGQGGYQQSAQTLPINNPASVNNDGTGNWGNQNNGLYGNCLDVLTGTVMGMGEAEDMPGSVDVVFFVANGAYTLMTPNFARNNSTATYMSNHSTDGISKWSTVNETEIAETKITLGQFDQIQTNPQISNVVKNAVNYSGWLQYPGTKLDGKVFAVKAELEGRTVYGLIAVVKHIGTDGSNGYLKIKIKAMGLDNNGDGSADASMYIRY
jgi:hypothetical protein